jgi:hypothetical protein
MHQDDPLLKYKAMLATMSAKDKVALDKMLRGELQAVWLPDHENIPQMVAYESRADLLLYGGAAGGGKTDLLCGTALTRHQKSVIFRAQYTDLRGIEERILQLANNGGREGYNGSDHILKTRDARVIELGAIGKPGQEQDWQGRPHDFIGFDEGAQLTAEKVRFVSTWNRSTTVGQRCRIIIGSNPPLGGEGDWLIEWFSPWLDPMSDNPAGPGELRWALIAPDGATMWRTGPDDCITFPGDDEPTFPKSRTFIPARLEDNRFLPASYRAQIQQLPEPMRSKLLKGDFLAGRSDHAWLVIPSDWVRKAQDRWSPAPPARQPMLTLGYDPAGTGVNSDAHVLSPLYNNYFATQTIFRGIDVKDGPKIAGQIMVVRKDNALVCIDMSGGWGGSARDHLNTNKVPTEGVVFSTKTLERSRDDKFRFYNMRAELWWRFREALDPDLGDAIALPPDERLFAELTAPRWTPRGDAILIEEKEDIKSRLGTSTDRADAAIIAWHFRKRALLRNAGDGPNGPFAESEEIDDPFEDY